MTDIDIPSLTAGLTAIRTALRDDAPLAEIDWDRYLTEAAEALSRLTSPLPEEIAHLVQRMKYWSGPSEHWPKVAREACEAAAAALERMAQENESLREDRDAMTMAATDAFGEHDGFCDIIEKLEARIRELEAECDGVREANIALAGLANDRLAERDAIQAKTIEECAELAADRAETFHNEARRMAARDIRDAIRALMPAKETP